jgi:hypothetical protein
MSEEKKEELFNLNLLQMLVLAANVVKAKTLPEQVGYLDWEVPFWRFTARLEKFGATMKKSELEAALWACNLLDEEGEFFNVTSEDLTTFINKLLNYKKRRLHFDEVYNQIKDRPKMGRPNKTSFDKVRRKQKKDL